MESSVEGEIQTRARRRTWGLFVVAEEEEDVKKGPDSVLAASRNLVNRSEHVSKSRPYPPSKLLSSFKKERISLSFVFLTKGETTVPGYLALGAELGRAVAPWF